MRIISAQYQHARIGFPRVILKWNYDGGRHRDPYITVKGIIKPWQWRYGRESVFCKDIEDEIACFDDWIVSRFSEDVSVQG